MAHFLPPEHVRQVNKLEWPYETKYPLCTHEFFLSVRHKHGGIYKSPDGKGGLSYPVISTKENEIV